MISKCRILMVVGGGEPVEVVAIISRVGMNITRKFDEAAVCLAGLLGPLACDIITGATSCGTPHPCKCAHWTADDIH